MCLFQAVVGMPMRLSHYPWTTGLNVLNGGNGSRAFGTKKQSPIKASTILRILLTECTFMWVLIHLKLRNTLKDFCGFLSIQLIMTLCFM